MGRKKNIDKRELSRYASTYICISTRLLRSSVIQNKCQTQQKCSRSLNLVRKKTAISGIVKQTGSNSKVVFYVRGYRGAMQVYAFTVDHSKIRGSQILPSP